MKIISDKVGKKPGVRILTVELTNNEVLIALVGDSHYRLGYPLEDDVLFGRQLISATGVSWCVIEQKWVA